MNWEKKLVNIKNQADYKHQQMKNKRVAEIKEKFALYGHRIGPICKAFAKGIGYKYKESPDNLKRKLGLTPNLEESYYIAMYEALGSESDSYNSYGAFIHEAYISVFVTVAKGDYTFHNSENITFEEFSEEKLMDILERFYSEALQWKYDF